MGLNIDAKDVGYLGKCCMRIIFSLKKEIHRLVPSILPLIWTRFYKRFFVWNEHGIVHFFLFYSLSCPVSLLAIIVLISSYQPKCCQQQKETHHHPSAVFVVHFTTFFRSKIVLTRSMLLCWASFKNYVALTIPVSFSYSQT